MPLMNQSSDPQAIQLSIVWYSPTGWGLFTVKALNMKTQKYIRYVVCICSFNKPVYI